MLCFETPAGGSALSAGFVLVRSAVGQHVPQLSSISSDSGAAALFRIVLAQRFKLGPNGRLLIAV